MTLTRILHCGLTHSVRFPLLFAFAVGRFSNGVGGCNRGRPRLAVPRCTRRGMLQLMLNAFETALPAAFESFVFGYRPCGLIGCFSCLLYVNRRKQAGQRAPEVPPTAPKWKCQHGPPVAPLRALPLPPTSLRWTGAERQQPFKARCADR